MNTARTILGVHIEDQFLNLVCLRRTANGLKVCGSTTEPLEEGVVLDGRVVSEKTVANKIRAFCKANKLRGPQVVMSPSCAAIVLKSSEYFTGSDAQTQRQVDEQIKKYTLFGNQEIIFDHCTIHSDDLASDRCTVLEAITTRQVSDAYLAVAQKARLKLMRIEPAVLPLVKLVYGGLTEETDGISLLLALESKAGTISVFDKTVPRLCQNVSIGINDIMANDDGIERLRSQLKNVLEYARSLSSSVSPGILIRVAAICPSETLKQIAAKLEATLGDVAVESVTSTDIMDFFNIESTGPQEPPVFSLAQALAAFNVSHFSGQLDLVSQKSLVVCKTQQEMSLTAKGMVAVVLLALVIRVPFKMEIGSIEAASEEIKNSTANMMSMQERITSLADQVDGLNKKQAAYTQANKTLAVLPWHAFLESLPGMVPETVRILSISNAGPGHFRLQGEAWVESDVRRFQQSLKDNEWIKTAKIQSINYGERESYVIVKYEIVCEAQLEETDL